ncbi:hypothetical protein K3495_g10002 [Podosphaera aphanis]|nr:hypothetical protein K3495_g10002 [Podosphaera aphanis]
MPSCSPLRIHRRCTAEPKEKFPKIKAVESLASLISSTNGADLNSPTHALPYSPLTPKERIQSFLFNTNWARADQLSTILELGEGSSRNTPVPSLIANFSSRKEKPGEKTRSPSKLNINHPSDPAHIMSERRSSSISPKMVRPPPRDLESISRIDASLVFEHFTTTDAWELGSTNQNQTIFHTVTHSGVMPDNETWVDRKRRTVLRWGCSTWFMACKFGGDEVAFREKYGLGNSAGKYAIHGGGVPIRVTGVEGVVAVVVVSGLKQDENHAVIVEVIKDLYY